MKSGIKVRHRLFRGSNASPAHVHMHITAPTTLHIEQRMAHRASFLRAFLKRSYGPIMTVYERVKSSCTQKNIFRRETIDWKVTISHSVHAYPSKIPRAVLGIRGVVYHSSALIIISARRDHCDFLAWNGIRHKGNGHKARPYWCFTITYMSFIWARNIRTMGFRRITFPSAKKKEKRYRYSISMRLPGRKDEGLYFCVRRDFKKFPRLDASGFVCLQ